MVLPPVYDILITLPPYNCNLSVELNWFMSSISETIATTLTYLVHLISSTSLHFHSSFSDRGSFLLVPWIAFLMRLKFHIMDSRKRQQTGLRTLADLRLTIMKNHTNIDSIPIWKRYVTPIGERSSYGSGRITAILYRHVWWGAWIGLESTWGLSILFVPTQKLRKRFQGYSLCKPQISPGKWI